MIAPAVSVPPVTVFLVAGEESGDILGAALMAALSGRLEGRVRFAGVGGSRMAAAGIVSLFPMEELALHGATAVIAKLPRLFALMRQTVDAVIAAKPDVLVLVDAPAFNVRLARRVRRRDRTIPIVDYVSPQVWAHNAWRARRMAPNIDRILAILPFEPEVHRRLGGPPCVYVGHPLLERLDVLRPAAGERTPIAETRTPTLLVLPGSRRSEIRRLMEPFGAALPLIAERVPGVRFVLPAVARLRDEIEAAVGKWPLRPAIVFGEEAKLSAFREAHAALAASGTVTLELALSGVPMAVAYKVDALVRPLKRFLLSRSIVLANIVLDENVVPEFIDRECTPEKLAAAIVPLLSDTPARQTQVAAFERLDRLMATGSTAPADLAASAVTDVLAARRVPAISAG